MRDHLIERLFSLFTSQERAVAIAGDLAEEREQRGSFRFWLDAFRITFALLRQDLAAAHLLIGLVLLAPPILGGIAAIFLFPGLMDSPFRWMVLLSIWCGGAIWAGRALVAIAAPPGRGMAACATLALSAGAALTLFHASGVVAGVSLLTGGVIAHRESRRIPS